MNQNTSVVGSALRIDAAGIVVEVVVAQQAERVLPSLQRVQESVGGEYKGMLGGKNRLRGEMDRAQGDSSSSSVARVDDSRIQRAGRRRRSGGKEARVTGFVVVFEIWVYEVKGMKSAGWKAFRCDHACWWYGGHLCLRAASRGGGGVGLLGLCW